MSKIIKESDCGNYWLVKQSDGTESWIEKKDSLLTKGYTIHTQSHYKGSTSLYKFAMDWKLNAWEFDILKRIVRCRHKGEFEKDLEKTKAVIDIYLKEFGDE